MLLNSRRYFAKRQTGKRFIFMKYHLFACLFLYYLLLLSACIQEFSCGTQLMSHYA